jgi:hypothetical protein
MANTTNLNLEKPIGTDQALVSVINSNMDKIDTFAGSTNQALSNVNNALSGADIINNQSDKDLNHYVTTSAWRIGNVSKLTNGPVWTLAGATGDLYVRANGSYISQIFVGNAGLATRLSADGGSTWNDWAGYATKSNAITTQKVSGYIRFDDPSTNIGFGINPTNNRMFIQDSDGTIKYFNLTAMT